MTALLGAKTVQMALKGAEQVTEQEIIAKAKRDYHKKWRQRNNEHVREYHRKWRKRNPDKLKQYHDRYWLNKADQDN